MSQNWSGAKLSLVNVSSQTYAGLHRFSQTNPAWFIAALCTFWTVWCGKTYYQKTCKLRFFIGRLEQSCHHPLGLDKCCGYIAHFAAEAVVLLESACGLTLQWMPWMAIKKARFHKYTSNKYLAWNLKTGWLEKNSVATELLYILKQVHKNVFSYRMNWSM